MSVSSVSSSTSSSFTAPLSQTQMNRPREAEGDGDKDDGKKVAPQTSATSTPTVNTSGQVVGGIINVKA